MAAKFPFSSHSVSYIHGDSISMKKKILTLDRIFLVFIDFSTTISVRRYFYDLVAGDVLEDKTQELIAKNGNGATLWDRPGGPTSSTARYDAFRIDFGWTPCHVAYVLNAPDGCRFAQSETDDPLDAIVFRSSKVELDDAGAPKVVNYLPNYSFYNAQYGAVDIHRESWEHQRVGTATAVPVLSFDNFMTVDSMETSIGKYDPNNPGPTWSYCMDIHIEMAFKAAMKPFLSAQILETEEWQDETTVEPKPFILIFDPPQDNGGTGGPPR